MEGLFDFLGIFFYYPIFNVLMFLFWLVRDFGLSIVLLTILVRLAMVPMTFKQLHSQRKMMELQPRIAELKAQYGDDKQGFARAQMQLYREEGVSMFGGCLPLLLQLPFLYGLFFALQDGLHARVGETAAQHIDRINQALYPFMKFASVTLPGNSHPLDTTLAWFSWLPGHPVLNLAQADPYHVLPVLAALFTFIQVRMIQGVRKPLQPSPNADPKAIAQANAQQSAMSVMTYITPVITLVIGWQYAAGLSLYWTVGTMFAVVQQYFIYGWGGLFKGIPRLEQWAARKNAEREARREAKLIAKGVIAAPAVVDGTLASGGTAKNGAGTGKLSPRPFPTLMKPKETPTSGSALKTEPAASNGASSASKTAEKKPGSEATNGSKVSARGAGAGPASKGGSPTNTARSGTPQQRKVPPRSSTLPKPKGGKK